jgi:hypothetical protein
MKLSPFPANQENIMTICPVALAVGCKKCPIFSICPVKSQIGDYIPPKKPDTKEPVPKKKASRKAAPKKRK